jgi:hypothetical protein
VGVAVLVGVGVAVLVDVGVGVLVGVGLNVAICPRQAADTVVVAVVEYVSVAVTTWSAPA